MVTVKEWATMGDGGHSFRVEGCNPPWASGPTVAGELVCRWCKQRFPNDPSKRSTAFSECPETAALPDDVTIDGYRQWVAERL